MKRFLFICLLYLISFSVLAQKVTIKVSKTKNSGLATWQIIDDQNTIVFSGTEYLQNDTVSFSLDANKRYFLKISVSGNNNPGSSICTLDLNGEPLLFIKSDIGEGDHIFPFFTGIKSIDAKITGGANAVISDFPWQIYYISGKSLCGGSIIGSNWVVTAAHCTKNSTGGTTPASQMFVRVGLNNPSNVNEGKTYSVSEAIVNEGYNSQTYLNEVSFSLNANKRYFLKISVSENNPGSSICTLELNGEPLLFIKSDIGEGDHLFPFFTGIRSINAKITGGTNSVISDFPWQVYYISGNYRCGGSIIGSNWVVTAAHCTKSSTGSAIPASQMFVRVGLNNPSNTNEGKSYSVSEAIVNESYNSQTLLNVSLF
jgi:V8-like Glu-specific endopeptidase